MTLRELVESALRAQGFDGLYSQDCACEIGDLWPCGCVDGNCVMGHYTQCPGEDCEAKGRKHFHIGKGSREQPSVIQIQRYDLVDHFDASSEMEPSQEHGKWVKFADHEQALAAERARVIREMVKPLMNELRSARSLLIPNARPDDLATERRDVDMVLAIVEAKLKETP